MPKLALADLCAAVLAVLVAVLGLRRLLRARAAPQPAERKPGEWAPVDFRYPPVAPHPGFDLHTTPPVPYRPFRGGNYPVTMGIRAMPWDAWVELDREYLATLALRKARVAARGAQVVRTLPGAERAALEFCTELAAFLAQRYPQVFRVQRVRDGGGLGAGDSVGGARGGRIKVVEILPTGDRWDLDAADPMLVGGLLADDVALMVERADGLYTLQAGCICVPGSWRLVDKIGRTLEEIHVSGGVYQYKEKLQPSMDRFFRRMAVDKPVARNNYTFQADPGLAWAHALHGDEDAFDQATKRPRAGSGAPPPPPPDPDADMSALFFRSERQTLRRLPRTGCVAFTIRTYLHGVPALAREAGVPGRLAAAVRSWPDAVLRRKELAPHRARLLPWLDALHAQQVAAGVVGAQDTAARYPY